MGIFYRDQRVRHPSGRLVQIERGPYAGDGGLLHYDFREVYGNGSVSALSETSVVWDEPRASKQRIRKKLCIVSHSRERYSVVVTARDGNRRVSGTLFDKVNPLGADKPVRDFDVSAKDGVFAVTVDERRAAVKFDLAKGTVVPAAITPLPTSSAALLDCTKCGACCIEAGTVTLDFVADREVPDHLVEQRELSKAFVMARHIGGRCKALDGVIGSDCSCSIYDKRPRVCRDFTPGSMSCALAIKSMQTNLRSGYLRRGYGVNWRETV